MGERATTTATLWEPLSDDAREVFSHSFRVCGALRILRGRRRRERPNQIKGARKEGEGGRGKIALLVRTKAIEKSEKPEGSE